ncbi:MAG: hypothetical protein ABIL09_17460 [Gemmatimonadota bacterium]
MATAISAANFKTALGNCYDSISAGDYPAAWKYYAMAEAQNSGLLLESSEAGMSSRRRDALDGLRKALQQVQNAASTTDNENRLTTTQTRHGR